MQNNLISYLQLFRPIPETDQEKIVKAFDCHHYRSGETVTKLGDIIGDLFFIEEGILKIYVLGEEDQELTYYFLKEHRMTGFLYSMYGNIPTEQGLRAACDTKLLKIEKNALFDLYGQIPYLKELINEIAALSMSDMIRVKHTYFGINSSKRYQLFLEKQSEIALKVPQIAIASYLGITPQSLSRIRKTTR